jgi:membrane-bound lytic murein transglycosylase D
MKDFCRHCRFLTVIIPLFLGACATTPQPGNQQVVESATPAADSFVGEHDPGNEISPTYAGIVDDQVPAVSGEPVDSPDINVSSQWEDNATAQEQVTLHIEDQPAVETAPVELELVERVATEAPQDLWDRLRASFALGNLEGSRSQLAAHERWFESNPEYFERLSERGYWLLPYILREVEKRGMPGEIALLPAVESAYRHEATSRSHAAGLWQLISDTGTRFGLRQDWWMDARRDMVLSTQAALDYLEYLYDHFGGDWELALAAYNAGEGTVRRAVAINRAANKSVDFSSLQLRSETSLYVPKLFALRNVIRDPRHFGIALKTIPDIQTLAIIDAGIQTDLTVAASLIPISAKTLQGFNNGYRRGVTAPDGPHHIVVPAAHAASLKANLASLNRNQRMRWTQHQVRKGEYLGRIARNYGMTVNSIVRANELTSHLIQPGQVLKIPLSTGHAQVASFSIFDMDIQDGDTIYTVKEGDSLWAISRNTGVSLAALLRWNGITKNTTLLPGQQLIVGRSS